MKYKSLFMSRSLHKMILRHDKKTRQIQYFTIHPRSSVFIHFGQRLLIFIISSYL